MPGNEQLQISPPPSIDGFCFEQEHHCLEHEKDKSNNPHFGHKAPPKKPQCSCPQLCVAICARHKLQILDSKTCTVQIR